MGAGLHLWGLLPQLALQVLRDHVGLVMLSEVITAHEAFLTLATLEAFVPWKSKRDAVTQSPRTDLALTLAPAPREEHVRCEADFHLSPA